MKSLPIFAILGFLLVVNNAQAQDPCIQRSWKEPYKTSWLLNDGGNQAKHIMHWMEYLAVRPDGMTATVTAWDEGGSNVTVFKNDGNIQSIPVGSGTGGWGRGSMIGVALDNEYTYQLLSQNGCDGGNTSLNVNGLPQYPMCGDAYTWKTVRRYKISNGGPAPFSKGYGYMGDMLIVHSGPGDLKGIALLKNELFVADESGDSVKVYNKTTMDSKPLRKFRFKDGIGQLSPDNAGGMWMLQPKAKQIVRFDIATGNLLGQKITFPNDVVPSTFFVDTVANRILVADNGINQNIRIYTDITGSPAFSSTFGKQFGIFSGVAGKYEPLKLFDIKGVGADASGNIYVANSAPGGGAVLQAYKPDGTLIWDKKGLVFTSTACADPLNINDVYTFDKRVKMDYSKTEAGKEWSFEAYTLNRFKYPDDPRIHGGFYTSSWIKYINGQKFLFATDMYASQLAGFRFSPGTDGEIAIPCLLMNIGGWDVNSAYPAKLGTEKDFIWMDKNGDGAIQNDEFTYKSGFDNPYSMAVWVDEEGNIWKGIREKGVRYIPLKELNSFGVPVYDFADSKILDIANGDIGTNGVKRLVYNYADDELYITGFSSERPDKKSDGSSVDTWWSMGSTVCMYKNVLDTLRKKPSVNFKNVKPNWRIFIPFAADGDAGSENTGKSFNIGGDFMFIALARNGNINVYKRSNGEYLGQIKPGAEINRESGWTDINYSVNITKTPDEYLIFNEENAFAKVVMYRVKSFETNDKLFADLVPSDFEMLNANNEVISDLVQNQPVRFRVNIKNQGPGLVLSGKNFADGISFKVNFIVKNLTTGDSKTFTADTCSLELASGKSIQLVSYSNTKPYKWMVEKGKFSITTMVNPMLGSHVTECDRTNNTLVYNTHSYDTLHIETNPVNQSINVGGSATFTAEILGDEPITYKWYVNGIEKTSSANNQLVLSNASLEMNNAKIKVVATNHLGSITSSEATLTVNNPYGETRIGYLLKQSWFNINGVKLNDLRNHALFPYNPDSISFINKFEVPVNMTDNYGVKVSGWLIAPETGNYVFYIASDDNGELWLSTDSLPQNLSSKPIANVPDWTDSRQYNKYTEQTSATVYLEAGKKYYVEALFKEGVGGDNLSVAWKLPGGVTEIPIQSSHLAFYTQNPTVSAQNLKLERMSLSVYPSPANQYINVVTGSFNGMSEYFVADILGKIVKAGKLNLTENSNIKIDVSDLQSGVYILMLNNAEKVANAKFTIYR